MLSKINFNNVSYNQGTSNNHFELEMEIPNVIHNDMSRRVNIHFGLEDLVEAKTYNSEIKILSETKTLVMKFEILLIDTKIGECVIEVNKIFIREEKRKIFKKGKRIALYIRKYGEKMENVIDRLNKCVGKQQENCYNVINKQYSIRDKRNEGLFKDLVDMVRELPDELKNIIFDYYQKPRYFILTLKRPCVYRCGIRFNDKYYDNKTACIEIQVDQNRIIRYRDEKGGGSYYGGYSSIISDDTIVLFVKYKSNNIYSVEKKPHGEIHSYSRSFL